MRSVFLSVSLCVLAGCATVSVVPGEASVETSLTKNQSELRQASNDYCDQAVSRGWVEEGDALASLAETLMHGKSDAAGAPGFYAKRIGADSKAPSLVLGAIAVDSKTARSGLAAVAVEAEAVLKTGAEAASNRGDLMSLERALVRAQMAHRGFQEALDLVSERSDMDVRPIAGEVAAFADTIDATRSLADRLADRYVGEDPAGS